MSITRTISGLKGGKVALSYGDKSASTRPVLIQLKHSNDGHTGGFYPGNIDPEKIASTYAQTITARAGITPQVTGLTISGNAPTNLLGSVSSNVKKRAISSRRTPSLKTSPKQAVSPYDNYWQPWEGIAKMTNVSGPIGVIPRSFDYYLGWRQQSDISNGFASNDSFEFDVKLYNPAQSSDIGTRPFCPDGANSWFWASRTTDAEGHQLSDGGPLAWDTDLPQATVPYFDWADDLDPCYIIDFSAGILHPDQLQPDCDANGNCADMRYHFYVGAGVGTQLWSPYEIQVQKLTDNCGGIEVDPSACVGLNNNDASRKQLAIPLSTDYNAPECTSFFLDYGQDPQADDLTQMYTQVSHFGQGEPDPNAPGSSDSRHYCNPG